MIDLSIAIIEDSNRRVLDMYGGMFNAIFGAKLSDYLDMKFGFDEDKFYSSITKPIDRYGSRAGQLLEILSLTTER